MAKVRFGDSIPPVASTGVRSGPGSWTGAGVQYTRGAGATSRFDRGKRGSRGAGGAGGRTGVGAGPVVRGAGPGLNKSSCCFS